MADLIDFVNYEDVNAGNVGLNDVFDVVGQLVTMNNYKVVEEGDTKKISVLFELQHPSGEKVRCKIWGCHADKLYNSQLEKKNKDEPQIVWLHNCRMTNWEGLQISNQLWGFTISINEPSKPIEDFKTLLATAQQQDGYEYPTIDIRLDKQVQSAYAKFTDPEIKTAYVLDEVRFMDKVCTFVVRGTVEKFAGNEGWYQHYCRVCEKKVIKSYCLEEEKNILSCTKCDRAVTDVFAKIRAIIYVQDKTGGCELALFDTHLSKITNRSVQWLNTTANNGPITSSEYPQELNQILQKQYAFIVKHSLYGEDKQYSGCTVSDLTDDAEVIKTLNQMLSDKETEYADFEDVDYGEADDNVCAQTPQSLKVQTVEVITDEPPTSNKQTPGSSGVKCKSNSPDDSEATDTPTGGTTTALGELKIPKMEKL
ncbi:uncharacterized protein [Rutidosis leptorrhynchoides]|uniref:uncharacterized protein n=1 Tax=Rutidosis leptorrhynchoides TaxID=125765 RepID=UPI003A9A045B